MSDSIEIYVDVLDESSVVSAIKRTGKLNKAIDNALDNALDEMADRIKVRLLKELSSFGLGDSSLVGTISISKVNGGLFISVGSDHAMFVEFGTGIVGAGSPHPDTSFEDVYWDYDINGHGEKGWWYPTTASDPNPVKKFDAKKNQWFGFTRGMESRPFMYNTWRYTRNIATKMINKHLRRIEI